MENAQLINILIDLFTTFLAAGSGLVLYRKMNGFQRLLLLQIILYIIADLSAVRFQAQNQQIFNLYLLLESLLLFAALKRHPGTTIHQKPLIIAGALFLATYIFDWITAPGFFYHAATVQALVCIVLYGLFIFHQFMVLEAADRNPPDIIIAAGMVIYFCVVLPYLGLLFYFHEADPILSRELFRLIVVLSGSLRYFLIGLGFVLQGIRTPLTIKQEIK